MNFWVGCLARWSFGIFSPFRFLFFAQSNALILQENSMAPIGIGHFNLTVGRLHFRPILADSVAVYFRSPGGGAFENPVL